MHDRTDLAGQVAIVTGSTGLIGSAIAVVLGASGASLVVHGTDEGRVEAAARAHRDNGVPALGVAGDATDTETARRLVDAAVTRFGRVDMLVNNAGMTHTYGEFLTYPEDMIDRVLRVNLRGPLVLSQLAATRMVAQGPGGRIVHITSVGGSQRAHSQNAVYDTTKGGLDALTRALATELGPLGIRVNAVGPAEISGDPPVPRGADLPLRHGGMAHDVAEAVRFLVSDAAAFVTGQILYVDGGLMAQLRSPAAPSRNGP